jgi:hypothetical protein
MKVIGRLIEDICESHLEGGGQAETEIYNFKHTTSRG